MNRQIQGYKDTGYYRYMQNEETIVSYMIIIIITVLTSKNDSLTARFYNRDIYFAKPLLHL